MLVVLKASPYGLGDQLTSVQMNILNDEITHALDGVGGGTYVLGANLNLSSTTFGLQLGKLEMNNSSSMNFGSSVTVNGSPTWSGTITWSGGGITVGAITLAKGPPDVLIIGSTAILSIPSGGTLSVAAGATTTFTNNPTFAAGHTVAFLGTVHFDATAEVESGGSLFVDSGAFFHLNGTGDVAGTLSVGGTLNISSGGAFHLQSGSSADLANGSTTVLAGSFVVSTGGLITIGATSSGISLLGIMTPSGAGRVRKRTFRPNGTGTPTFTIADADIFHWSALAANQTVTLGATGAGAGDHVEMSILGVGTANILTVNYAASSVALQLGTGLHYLARFYFDTQWQLYDVTT